MTRRIPPRARASRKAPCSSRAPNACISNTVFGIVMGAALSGSAFAGGVDVSADELFSDGVTLTTFDGSPLDIDGDGNIDLAVAANRNAPAARSRYYLGNGDGTFSATGVLLAQGMSSQIVAGDLDGDMIVDLLQGRRDLEDVLHVADGAGALLAGTNANADTFRTLSIAVGDLDGDDDLDFVAGNGKFGGVVSNPAQVNRFYENNGAGVFTAADITADADDTRGIALADIDGDGFLDVIAGNDETTPNSNRIYLNQTLTSGLGFAQEVDFGSADDQTSSILIGDLDMDGDPDIVVLNNVSGAASPGINRFFLNASTVGMVNVGAGTDISADTDRTSGGVLADFDGDGDLDLAVANLLAVDPLTQSSRNRLYLNQFVESGTVSFAAGIDISADEHMSRELAAGDIDDDGDIDIIVGNQDDPAGIKDRRYLNNGTADPFTNVAPVIDDQETLETAESTPLTVELGDLTVTDPDNIAADLTLTLQDGTNYTRTDNTITPNVAFTGVLTVAAVVSDGTDESEPFNLVISVDNDAPAFSSAPVLNATEGTAYTYNVTTVDPDTGDALSIVGLTVPAWLTLTDNTDGTATLTGTPAAGDVGNNAVSLQVSDGAAMATQDFIIDVAAVGAGNTAPTFTSTAVTDATAGTAYTYAVTASDADSDTLAITMPAGPAWLELTDNGDGTATLSGTPDSGDVGDHDVSLEVSDGTDTATQDFTITVAAAPSGNAEPAFTSTAVTNATEGTTYTYDVTASDDDAGDDLEITAPTLPDWLELMDNGDGTATLTGTPAAGDVGDHDVSLQISDGTDTATQDFTITVAADTVPPPPPPPRGGGGGASGLLSLMGLLACIAVRRSRGRHLANGPARRSAG